MRAFFERHPILSHVLGALSLLPLLAIEGGDGHHLFAFWQFAIPIAMSAIQTAMSYGNRPKGQDFSWIPPSKQEQFGNKLEKGFWRDQVGQNTGAPRPVFRTAAQALGDYATSDVMAPTGPAAPQFSGATARALAQSQNQMAQEAAQLEGQKRHVWALSGKMGATGRRADMQAAINSIHAATIGQNKADEGAWRQNVNANLANLGSTVASSVGGYLGSRATATPATGAAPSQTYGPPLPPPQSPGYSPGSGYVPSAPVPWWMDTNRPGYNPWALGTR
jgi:hypothetical protein